jgi:hypothetical protein
MARSEARAPHRPTPYRIETSTKGHAAGGRISRNGPPLADGGRKGLLRRLLRQVEIADQPDQGSDNPAPIGAIDSFNRRGGVPKHIRL